MEYDPLIYGNDKTERIVSIEPADDSIEIFTENSEGIVSSHVKPNKQWIVGDKPVGKNYKKLDGNLFYNYITYFENRQQYLKVRNDLKRSNIYSIYNPKEAHMVLNGLTYFKNMKHNEVSILAFDIETTGLNHDATAKLLLISNTFRRNGETVRKLFSYTEYEDEGEMIKEWCRWVREMDPTLLCGHNIFAYDLPYLQFIARKFGVRMMLGRDDSVMRFDQFESKFRKDATQFYHYHKIHIYGREIVDTLFLSIRYDVGRKYENYKLKYIIDFENLTKKDRTFYDGSKIRTNYTIPTEWALIQEYAKDDGDDALALYDLMSPSFFYITQSVAKPYQEILLSASGSQINSVMNRAYLQDGHSLPMATEPEKYEGAISFGNPGIYKNVYKIDVASLYPSIMIECEVYDEDKDPKGYFLHLVKTFTNRRLEHKKLAKTDRYYDDLQNAEKILINSMYGFLGATGLNFNSPSAAAFVTKTGRDILQKTIVWATSKPYENS